MNIDQYQEKGVAWLANAARAAGCSDEAGAGKSAQAILACRELNARRIRVVCRAVGVTNWRRQFDLWWPEHPKLDVLSYDMLSSSSAHRTRWASSQVDVLIGDEAHYLKSPKAKRTKVLYGSQCWGTGLVGRASRVFLLTATPAPNNILEMWPHFRALRPELITIKGKTLSYDEFRDRYTTWYPTVYGPRITGNKDGEELTAAVDAMWIRRPADTLGLRGLGWDHVPLDVEPTVDEPVEARELREALDSNSEAWGSAALSTYRRELGVVKALAVASIIGDELSVGAYQKIVIFAHHTSVIDSLAKSLAAYNPRTYRGGISRQAGDEAIDSFQSNPTCRVFIGQMDACGTSIDLTAADKVAFVESSWTPGTMYQCVRRVLRRGQTRFVNARVFSCAGTLDDAISASRVLKERNVSEVVKERAV